MHFLIFFHSEHVSFFCYLSTPEGNKKNYSVDYKVSVFHILPHELIIISSFQTSAVDNIVSLGGCVEKMMLGMAMYGRTYTLVNPNNHDIGDSTSGDGSPGPIFQAAVRNIILNA